MLSHRHWLMDLFRFLFPYSGQQSLIHPTYCSFFLELQVFFIYKNDWIYPMIKVCLLTSNAKHKKIPHTLQKFHILEKTIFYHLSIYLMGLSRQAIDTFYCCAIFISALTFYVGLCSFWMVFVAVNGIYANLMTIVIIHNQIQKSIQFHAMLNQHC